MKSIATSLGSRTKKIKIYLLAASSIVSPVSTFPPNPFQCPVPKPRFLKPRRICCWVRTKARVRILLPNITLQYTVTHVSLFIIFYKWKKRFNVQCSLQHLCQDYSAQYFQLIEKTVQANASSIYRRINCVRKQHSTQLGEHLVRLTYSST